MASPWKELVWQPSGLGVGAKKRTSQDKWCNTYKKNPCCRSRKKRCYHDGSNKDEDAVEESKENASSEPTREPTPSPGRVSEYNPESVLEELSVSTGQLPLEPAVPVQEALEASQRLKRVLVWYKRQKQTPYAPKLSDNHRRHLQDAGAFLQLPAATTDALLPIYLSSLDDLMPVMDGARVFREYSNGQASSYLVRAMCLAVCKTRQAAPFLRLATDGPVLKPLEFGSKLLKGLDAALKAGLERDRVVKVQILALMHLHNDGLGGVDRSSSYLSQAINEAWALSLHWNIHGNAEQQQNDRLWWSLRNFDRLNKPIMGAAPFMIDDADIGIERAAVRTGDYRSELLSVSLLLGDLMKSATRLYRATCKARVDDTDSFPSLSELTVGIDFDQFHRSHKCYLEIWYHVAAMLSCRFSGPGTTPYNRRLASADRILQIVHQERHDNLPPLPLVPYAMSMSTTMIYRALRDGQREIVSACSDLRMCCDALNSLSQRWTGVRGVAKLANRLWKVLSVSFSAEHADAIDNSEQVVGVEGQGPQATELLPNDAVSTVEGEMPKDVADFAPVRSGIGPAFFELDTAFDGLVSNAGMPSFFRPAMWDFWPTENGELGDVCPPPYQESPEQYHGLI